MKPQISTAQIVRSRVDELTAPVEENARPLQRVTEEEKRQRVRAKISEIENTRGFPPIFDMYMRHHTYLRISLTEKCNFRCVYCMPTEGIQLSPKEHLLTNGEILRLVRLFAAHGVNKVRLTGGEPTIRKDLTEIVGSAGIKSVPGINDVGMTTNGAVLEKSLPALIAAGITKINISIDSLNKAKFEMMTRRNAFDKVFRAIEASRKLLPKVKLNTVVMKGQNEDEILDFVAYTADRNVDVRFIEYMPFGGNQFSRNKFYGYREMMEQIVNRYGDRVQRLQDSPNDTTKAYKIDGFVGQFGFITSMSDHFCNTCNRMRITADGNLKVCLHGNAETNLRDLIRSGSTDEELSRVIQRSVNNKKARHAGFRDGQPQESAQPTYDPDRRLRRQGSTNTLTHVGTDGQARQVDVSAKSQTIRLAVAQGTVILTPEISAQLSRNQIKKGDVLSVAKIASIMGAKQTALLIPLCHNVPLDHVDTDFIHDQENYLLHVRSSAKCTSSTGVEMEALTACTIAMLTVYDMCKAVSQKMKLTNIQLVHKSGGKTAFDSDEFPWPPKLPS